MAPRLFFKRDRAAYPVSAGGQFIQASFGRSRERQKLLWPTIYNPVKKARGQFFILPLALYLLVKQREYF